MITEYNKEYYAHKYRTKEGLAVMVLEDDDGLFKIYEKRHVVTSIGAKIGKLIVARTECTLDDAVEYCEKNYVNSEAK